MAGLSLLSEGSRDDFLCRLPGDWTLDSGFDPRRRLGKFALMPGRGKIAARRRKRRPQIIHSVKLLGCRHPVYGFHYCWHGFALFAFQHILYHIQPFTSNKRKRTSSAFAQPPGNEQQQPSRRKANRLYLKRREIHQQRSRVGERHAQHEYHKRRNEPAGICHLPCSIQLRYSVWPYLLKWILSAQQCVSTRASDESLFPVFRKVIKDASSCHFQGKRIHLVCCPFFNSEIICAAIENTLWAFIMQMQFIESSKHCNCLHSIDN